MLGNYIVSTSRHGVSAARPGWVLAARRASSLEGARCAVCCREAQWPEAPCGPVCGYSQAVLERFVGVEDDMATCLMYLAVAEGYDVATNLANGRFRTGCEELPVHDLGVNMLVYALTREGSLAQKLVAAH